MYELTVSGYSRRPPHVVADEKGFFKDQNLDVNFHLVKLAPLHNQEMAAGKWSMTLSSADTMIARSTGESVDYVLFMQAEEGLGAYLIGQPGITSVEDLRGKLLAADPVDSNLDVIRMKIMRDHGVVEDEYDYEVIGSTPARAQALLEGKVSAAMLTPPSSDKVLEEGCVLLASGEDHVPDWPLACGWGLRSWVESHQEVVVRFICAWANSTDWLLDPANQEETIALLIEKSGLTRERAIHAYKRVVPKGRINPDAIRRNLELRIELGLYLPPHHPAEQFYDMSYWCEATGLPAPEAAGAPVSTAG